MGRKTSQFAWYQVRLRTILLVIGLVAIGLALWSEFVRPYQRQAQIAVQIKAVGGTVETRGGPLWLQRIAGADNVKEITQVNLSDADPSPELLAALQDLPRLEVLILGGDNITEESVPQLPPCKTLQVAIFDSTYLSLAKLDEFRAARPGVFVGRTDRRSYRQLKQLGTCTAITFKLLTDVRADVNSRIAQDYLKEVDRVNVIYADDETLQAVSRLFSLESLGIKSLIPGSATSGSGARDEVSLYQVLTQLKRIKKLSLLEISSDWQVAIGQLPALEDLTISDFGKDTQRGSQQIHHELVTDEDVLQIARRFPGLRGLGVSHSLVGALDEWPPLPLERLDLSSTNVDDNDLAAIVRLFPALESLNLNTTWVTDAGLPALLPLNNLQELQLSDTRVTSASFETFRQLSRLRRVTLGLWQAQFELIKREGTPFPWDQDSDNNAGFMQVVPQEFAPSPQRIREVREALSQSAFAESIIDDSSPAAKRTVPFSVQLTALECRCLDAIPVTREILHVNATDRLLDDAGLREVVRAFPNLQSLKLEDTWVTDGGMEELAKLEQLKSLSLSGTRVTSEGIGKLISLIMLEELVLPAAADGDCVVRLLKLPYLISVHGGRSSRPVPPNTAYDVQEFHKLATTIWARRKDRGVQSTEQFEVIDSNGDWKQETVSNAGKLLEFMLNDGGLTPDAEAELRSRQ